MGRAVVVQVVDRRSVADLHARVIDGADQDRVEIAPGQPIVRRDPLTAEPRAHVDDEVAISVVEYPRAELIARVEYVVEHAELLQRAQRVRRLVDADAIDVRLRLDLDDVDLVARVRERRRPAKATDPGANNEDLPLRHQCLLMDARGAPRVGSLDVWRPGPARRAGNPSIIESGIAMLR